MKELIIITGMNGAGKSEILNYFEDRDFFCIDNFPVNLFQYFNEVFSNNLTEDKKNRIAIVMDVRDKLFAQSFEKCLVKLREIEVDYRIIFLDARDEVLINRYNLSRRKHPLATSGNVIDGIRKERESLREIRNISDYIIDTSNFTVKDLRDEADTILAKNEKLSITIESFGFKYGIPLDLDLMFDLRFLPNPYYVEEYRDKTGNDEKVYNYVLSFDESKEFYDKLKEMIVYLLPKYEKEGKAYLNIGVGCSGGQHRSVSFVNKLFEELSEDKVYKIKKYHREVGDKKIV